MIMGRRSLSDEVFALLSGQPEVRRIQRSRISCGGAKRRVKIVRSAAPKLILSVTEPGEPRSEFDIDTTNVIETAGRVEQYLRKQGVAILNK